MNAVDYFNHAVNIYNQGRFRESIPEFIKALKTGEQDNDDVYRAFVYLGSACIGNDDYNGAIINLKKALAIKKDDFWVYYEFGRVHYFGIIDYQQALSYFNEAIHYNATHALSWDMKGLCEQHLGLYTDAKQSLTRGLRYAKISNQKVVPVIENEIKVLDSLIKARKSQSPVQNISDTIKKHFQKGKSLFADKKYNEALSEFNLALKDTVSDKKLTYSLLLFKGQCLKELLKYNLAIQVFDKAIASQPKLYNAYYEEGVLYFSTHIFVRSAVQWLIPEINSVSPAGGNLYEE